MHNSTDKTRPTTQRDDSAFSRAMRRNRRSTYRTMLITLPLLMLPMLFLLVIESRAGGVFSFDWLFLLWLAFPAIVLIIPFFMRRKMRRMEALVPAHDGIVCPRCVQPLTLTDEGSCGRCDRCGRRFLAEQLRQYWDLSLTDPLAGLALWRDMMRHQPAGQRRTVWQTLLRRHDNPVWNVAWILLTFVVAGAVFALLSGTSTLAGVLSFAHMIPFMLGMMLLMFNWKRRVGDVAFCAVCNYQMPPGLPRKTIAKCPECGESWSEIGGLTHGVVKRRRGPMIAAAALMVVGLLLIVSPGPVGRWRTKILPTSSLIYEVSQPQGGFTMNVWAALNSRTLSEEQRITLAEGLLAKRLSKSYSDRDDDNWLVAQIAAGTLPDAPVDRYYREALDVWLIAPAKAKVGEQVTVAIGTEYRAGGGRNPTPIVLIAGFFVNDDPQPKGRQQQAIDGIMLGQVRLHYARSDAGPGNGPVLNITPEAPGAVNVRLEFWIAHAPMGTVNTITWNEDGTPVTPPGAVWMEHRVIEHVIDVSE